MCSFFFFSPPPIPLLLEKLPHFTARGIGFGNLIKKTKPQPVQWFLGSSDSVFQELELRDGDLVVQEPSSGQRIRVNK